MEGAWHMNRIGKNIKKARSEKGYTQEQLAQKLCVTRNTISNYETGHSNPDIEMLQLLAEALKTEYIDLWREERTVSRSDMEKRDSEKGYLACNCRINDGDFFFINQIWK